MALKPAGKDFRPRATDGRLRTAGDLASAQAPLDPNGKKAKPEPRELNVFSKDLRDSEYDFKPIVMDADLEDSDPKDWSALESVDSSTSETPTAPASSALQKQIAAAEKANTQPKEKESGS
jgi:hypothetical protein